MFIFLKLAINIFKLQHDKRNKIYEGGEMRNIFKDELLMKKKPPVNDSL